jgi:protein AbiQ
MELRKLENLFYEENAHLVEVMDKSAGKWNDDKTRGYGIVVIEAGELRFGIPLRSGIRQEHAFITVAGTGKGLDYSKAVLLLKDEYISEIAFKIPDAEFVRIKEKSHRITLEFTKYVKHYKKGVANADRNVLRPYKFSTLQNYHKELGLT